VTARPPAPFPFVPDLLAGRKALVTGGGTGIGEGIATALGLAGADLVIAARRVEVLDEAAGRLRERTGRAVTVEPVDIRDLDGVKAMAERHPDVDVLVNNAGGHFAQRARAFSPNGWRTVIDLNLNGTWNMTQTFGDRMLDGDGGTICHILMPIGRGAPGLAHSVAARAAVMELTRTLAFEWAPKVRLNCVGPGQVRTQGWDETYEESVGGRVGEQPLGFEGSVHDIANAVVYLVSPAARFVTGELLRVDGGLGNQGHMSALPEDGYPERSAPPSHL
jgi:NAD(P)-dependent dehydrogenase (short-subunit alcohol dehydrogenase family)